MAGAVLDWPASSGPTVPGNAPPCHAAPGTPSLAVSGLNPPRQIAPARPSLVARRPVAPGHVRACLPSLAPPSPSRRGRPGRTGSGLACQAAPGSPNHAAPRLGLVWPDRAKACRVPPRLAGLARPSHNASHPCQVLPNFRLVRLAIRAAGRAAVAGPCLSWLSPLPFPLSCARISFSAPSTHQGIPRMHHSNQAPRRRLVRAG